MALVLTATQGEPVSAQAPTTAPLAEVAIDVSRLPTEVQARAAAAAAEATARYREWLGPPPLPSVSLTPRPWRGQASRQSNEVVLDVPWRDAEPSMDIESQVAHGIARLWWPHLPADPAIEGIINGMAWYLQSRVVEDLFDRRFLKGAHSFDGVRLFGRAVPWTFQLLPLGRSTAGLGRAEFLNRDQRLPSARRLPLDFSAATARTALTFGTLERYVGWPALQGSLRALAAPATPVLSSSETLTRALSASLGQDVSWLFAQALDPVRHFDYALQGFTSQSDGQPCAATPCFRTQVTVIRRGEALFTGTSASPVGAFEAGDAMELAVEFSDGGVAFARWDGRGASRVFEFESSTPAVVARLDPNRVLLLDANYLDDVRRARSVSNVPIGKWVAQWLVWLQDAMLIYSF